MFHMSDSFGEEKDYVLSSQVINKDCEQSCSFVLCLDVIDLLLYVVIWANKNIQSQSGLLWKDMKDHFNRL